MTTRLETRKSIRIGMRNSIKRFGKTYTREQGKKLIKQLKEMKEPEKEFTLMYIEEYKKHFPNVQL
mgnify:CR=1 FL=1